MRVDRTFYIIYAAVTVFLGIIVLALAVAILWPIIIVILVIVGLCQVLPSPKGKAS